MSRLNKYTWRTEVRKINIIILLFLLTSLIGLYAEEPRFVINSGHTDSVSALENLENKNLIFSGSHDGTVKVWDIRNSRIKYQTQISHMPVRKIAVSKNGEPYAAAVISDGINSEKLIVWNWKNGETLFTHRLSESPLFLLFSPKGSFLMYAKTDWDSLVFLDTKTGKQIKMIPEGFGIVSNAFISNSEKTLLTYNNSGSIQYWDLRKGVRKTKIPTIADLEHISFTSNGRYMTGSNGKEILLIDLLSGKSIASLPVKDLVNSAIDPKHDKLVWIESISRDIKISTASITGEGFSNIDESIIRNFKKPSAILFNSGRIFTAYSDGSIYKKDSFSDNMEVFSENEILDIQDFAINKTALAITSPGKILSISSAFLTKKGPSGSDPEEGSTVLNIDKSSSYGISSGKDSDFLIWESDSETGGEIRILNSEKGEIRTLTTISAPLISAEYNKESILTLDKNGECRILGYDDGNEEFKYTSFGLRAVEFIEGTNIVAGRNSSSTLPSPLLHINTRTGETVPIDDSDLLIFDLEYDSLTRKLYTIGFENRNNIMRTVLKQHTGRNHDRAETLIAFAGENIGASFVSDKNSSKIFTSLGYDGIKMLYWGGFTALDKSFSTPKELKLGDKLLASLNQDSSITIFDSSNGSKIMDLFIFKDLSWAAMMSDNKFYVSPSSEKYINIYDGSSDKELLKSKYMLR